VFCVHLAIGQPQTGTSGVVWSVRAGGKDHPSRTKPQPAGSLTPLQPQTARRAAVLGQASKAFDLFGADAQLDSSHHAFVVIYLIFILHMFRAHLVAEEFVFKRHFFSLLNICVTLTVKLKFEYVFF
jgi:hypothetical protein